MSLKISIATETVQAVVRLS